MNEKKEPNLEELLNSYLDGELNERQLTEIKRLISHDQQVAAKLQRLQRTKELLGALPKSPAPPAVLQGVKTHLEGKMLRSKFPVVTERRAGARHLMLRRTLAAAAMIGLVSVLALLVFNILKPESPTQSQPAEIARPETAREVIHEVAIETPQPASLTIDEVLGVDALPVVLELRTTELRAVNSAIGRAIYDSGLLDCTNIEHLPNEHIYSLSCGQENTAALASDLRGLWGRIEATNLSLARESFGRQVIANNITAEQLVTILTQRDTKSRAKLAEDFAALNAMAALMPGRNILNNIQGRGYNLLTVDKPVLTSGRDLKARSLSGEKQAEKINLTIVVKAAE